jgi:hypothetical protein
MADITDIALNVGGWVVGGATALGGILVAYHYQERGRLRQEDRIGVFEPLRREMAGIVDFDLAKYNLALGYRVWTRSDAFSDILKRGALKPPRLGDLRQDLTRLVELDDLHGKAQSRFYEVREAEGKKVWEGTQVNGSELGGPVPLIRSTHSYGDNLVTGALARGDKEAWVRLFQAAILQLATRGTARAATPPEVIYDRMDAVVGPARNEFRSSGNALVAQADLIVKRLDAALAGKLVYKAR